jgi:hypothetical protein
MQVAEPVATAGAASEDRSRDGVELRGCGVDTWRPSWYVDMETPAAEWWLLNGTPAGAAAGGGFRLPDAIGGHQVGMSASGLVYAEGHPNPEGLAKAGELPAAYERLCDELRAAGVPLPAGNWGNVVNPERLRRGGKHGHRRAGAAGLARLDVTADFDTPSAVYGRELMRALSAVSLQRGSMTAAGSLGAQETISLRARGGRRVLARFYDKGLESATAPPFRLLRAEDQGRFPASRRRGIESIDAAYLRERFRRRWGPLAQAGKELGSVTVADPLVLAERIQQLAHRGVITPQQATRMAGNVVLDYVAAVEREGGSIEYAEDELIVHRGVSRTTLWRHRSELIRHGLIRDTGELAGEPIEVALAQPFELVDGLDPWA